jgi:hypothetical protein
MQYCDKDLPWNFRSVKQKYYRLTSLLDYDDKSQATHLENYVYSNFECTFPLLLPKEMTYVTVVMISHHTVYIFTEASVPTPQTSPKLRYEPSPPKNPRTYT